MSPSTVPGIVDSSLGVYIVRLFCNYFYSLPACMWFVYIFSILYLNYLTLLHVFKSTDSLIFFNNFNLRVSFFRMKNEYLSKWSIMSLFTKIFFYRVLESYYIFFFILFSSSLLHCIIVSGNWFTINIPHFSSI